MGSMRSSSYGPFPESAFVVAEKLCMAHDRVKRMGKKVRASSSFFSFP